MRIAAAGLAAMFCWAIAGAARAQDTSQDSGAIAVPPPPPITAAPSVITPEPLPPPAQPAPPGLVETPVPPLNADSGMPAPGQSAAAAPPPANNWVPGKTATIGVLDKIDGTVTQITIPTGGQSNVGDLQVSVQACLTRPRDEIPDAAIFLTAQNATTAGATPLYRGWMVRSVPGAAVVGDASEIFRVIGCS